MTTQVMLAAKCTTTRLMLASERLGAVGIVGRDVSLQIVSTRECYKADMSDIAWKKKSSTYIKKLEIRLEALFVKFGPSSR